MALNLLRFRSSVVACAFIVLLTSAPQLAYTQSEKVLHSFEGKSDGIGSESGLTFDANGNLYGVTPQGGQGCAILGCGTVYRLVPNGNGAWTETILHQFIGSDGNAPFTAVIFDAQGNLYGTTATRGAGNHGTAYKLSPSGGGAWTETVLHSFTGSDGNEPDGALVMDNAGHLYGTTNRGGSGGYGVVYRLDHRATDWHDLTLLNFGTPGGGLYPTGPLVMDSQGNLYGTTGRSGGAQGGVVFELVSQGNAWTEKVLYNFSGGIDGNLPNAGVTFDQAGNLYGTTVAGGPANLGLVFLLHPNADGTWTESTVYAFQSSADGTGPLGGITLDQQGNLYGTTSGGGAGGWGNVFRLVPTGDGSWTKTVLWQFSGGADGGQPWGNVILDAAGHVYGTTNYGGQRVIPCQQYGCGVVYEVTP